MSDNKLENIIKDTSLSEEERSKSISKELKELKSQNLKSITLEELSNVKLDLQSGNNKDEYLKDVTPLFIPLKAKTRTYVLVFNGSHHYLVKAKIENDFYLKYKNSYGKQKSIVIAHEPSTLVIPNWDGVRKITALCWYSTQIAETTHDPSQINYDIPVIENIVKYVHMVLESEIPRVLAEEIKGKKGFWDYFPYIMFLLNNFAWFLFTNAQTEQILKLLNPV